MRLHYSPKHQVRSESLKPTTHPPFDESTVPAHLAYELGSSHSSMCRLSKCTGWASRYTLFLRNVCTGPATASIPIVLAPRSDQYEMLRRMLVSQRDCLHKYLCIRIAHLWTPLPICVSTISTPLMIQNTLTISTWAKKQYICLV